MPGVAGREAKQFSRFPPETFAVGRDQPEIIPQAQILDAKGARRESLGVSEQGSEGGVNELGHGSRLKQTPATDTRRSIREPSFEEQKSPGDASSTIRPAPEKNHPSSGVDPSDSFLLRCPHTLTVRFVLLIPCGPSPSCALGFSEICEGASAYSEGAELEIWCVNDGNDPKVLAAAAERNGLVHRILPHPFAGRGNHWLGRLNAGLVYGMRLAVAERPGWHILRLDTDALIIGPWERRLLVAAQKTDVGLIGSNNLGSEGQPLSGDWWQTRLYRHRKFISRADDGPGLRIAWRPSSRMLTQTIRAAFRQVGQSPHPINGGVYAIPAHALSRLATLPLFRPEVCFEINSFTEDVLIGQCVLAVGSKFLVQNEPGDVIASCWKGLAAPTLPALVERGCSLIHSLKDHPPFREAETRDFFRARRLATGRATAP
jgi:hypothetical protein